MTNIDTDERYAMANNPELCLQGDGIAFDYYIKTQEDAIIWMDALIQNKHNLKTIPREHQEKLRKLGILITGAQYYSSIKPPSPIHADELDKNPPPPVEFVVEQILPTGLTIFAAPMKTGKSFAAMDLCASVAMGIPFWGRRTQQTETLYINYEGDDTGDYARAKTMRLKGQLPHGMMIEYKAPRRDTELQLYLEMVKAAHPALKLVVIDMMSKVQQSKTRGMDAYQAAYALYGQLQRIAIQNNMAIVGLMHTSKVNSVLSSFDDPFNAIQGSMGSAGAADAIWMIAGKRLEKQKRFLTSGRRITQSIDALVQLGEDMRWRFVGEKADLEQLEYERAPIVKTIRVLMQKESCVRYKTQDLQTIIMGIAGEPYSTHDALRADIKKYADRLHDEGYLITPSKSVRLKGHTGTTRVIEISRWRKITMPAEAAEQTEIPT